MWQFLFLLKILNGIMSRFVFSVFVKKADDLKCFCELNEDTGDYKNFQYYKFEKEHIGKNNIYDYEGGINEVILKEKTNQSLEFI